MVVEDTTALSASPLISMRNMILRLMLDLLCTSKTFVQKFISNVSSQWAVLFMGKHIHPHTAILASKVFVKLSIEESVFNKSNGLVPVVSYYMANHRHSLQQYAVWLAYFAGIGDEILNWDAPFEYNAFIPKLLNGIAGTTRKINADVAKIITKMLKVSVRDVVIGSFDSKTEMLVVNAIKATIQSFTEMFIASDDVKQALSASNIIESFMFLLHMCVFPDSIEQIKLGSPVAMEEPGRRQFLKDGQTEEKFTSFGVEK